MKKQFFGIDSATLVLPLDKVQIVNVSAVERSVIVGEETGEIKGVKEQGAPPTRINGIAYKYVIQRNAITKDGAQDVVKIDVNAKQLKARYLQGITRDNVKHLYDFHIDLGDIYCSYEDFLSGRLIDVDFKIDFHLSSKQDAINNYQTLFSLVNPKLKAQGAPFFKNWSEPNNMGLEFYDRKVLKRRNPPPSKQNTRIYLKGIELLNKSYEFWSTYLEPLGIDAENVLRIETWGGKNANTFYRYGFEDTSLNGVLDITMAQAMPMFKKPFSHFFEGTARDKVKPNSMTFNQELHFLRLKEFINEGFGIDEAIELTIQMSSIELSPRNKTSIRKRMLDSYYTFQKIIGEQVQMKMHLDSDIRPFLI